MAVIDAVVIGRNEGARLGAAIAALRADVRRVVYVDSASSDDSVAVARAAGADAVVELAPPLSAARARNAGLRALSDDPPEFIQLVDGDCVVVAGWIAAGLEALNARPDLAAVFGRVREEAPGTSVYNRMQDHEWDMVVRGGASFTGVFLGRFAPLLETGGFREDLIAGEEGEFCDRLRAAGWQVAPVGQEMATHDLAMHRLGPFWRRAVRAGHSFAQVATVTPGAYRAERLRAWVWAVVLPLAAVLLLPWIGGLALAGLGALYLASNLRNARRLRAEGFSRRHAAAGAALLTLSKFANLQGMLTWAIRRWRGREPGLIEYR
ncbi:glycosyltransferase [Rhodobacteraceae bacterium 2376]|uniref:Glycosyltransferase n=1 Tax=Rhabdonatronobacter sediminivivens TaxID=2743469 RepID=A0A7Z0KYU7_9RHOB|nr:glycosyltransferase family A protein [Rhabdonatronobacter sediminivivens]NYS25987.1 glycosyltransferase [Rhabdonatronobacter sediminivivens]